MAQAIRERTNELAVLKTLGFSDGRILSLVLVESCLIAHRRRRARAGGVVPDRLLRRHADQRHGAAALPAGAGHRDRRSDHRRAGLATGLWPALQASRLRIVDALRKG